MKEYGPLEGGALSFDDILLVPQRGDITSRSEIDLTMKLDNSIKLSLPVISSPMDTITEWQMGRAMAEAGGMGIIHRYMSIEEQVRQVSKTVLKPKVGKPLAGAAIGATGDYFERAQALHDADVRVILVDVANGHSQVAIDAVWKLATEFEDVHIMAGNVSTYMGWLHLTDAGADSVRVGIGGGSCCTTRLVSGHGIPTLASLLEISKVRHLREQQGRPFARIVADGGLRTPGDIVKAFAAGADAVMLGSMLAGTTETPGELDDNGYKEFRGMASASAQAAYRRVRSEGNDVGRGDQRQAGAEENGRSEGIATKVPAGGSVAGRLSEIRAGIQSGCSYTGVKVLNELYRNAFYVKVTEGGRRESTPHAIR